MDREIGLHRYGLPGSPICAVLLHVQCCYMCGAATCAVLPGLLYIRRPSPAPSAPHTNSAPQPMWLRGTVAYAFDGYRTRGRGAPRPTGPRTSHAGTW
ncbi:hypothetical protein GCM10022284_07140 [Streptomyces hundungensis]